MTGQIQSVIFDNTKWNIPKAVEWLKANNFIAQKVDIKPRTYRFRQFDPSRFKRYRTKTTAKGITFIIGF